MGFKLFGFEVASNGEIRKLREDVAALADLERQLEDIGWVNINSTSTGLAIEARESYVKMVKRSRLAFVKNPIVSQAVETTTNYVFGEGVSDPKAKSPDVQEIITEFWKDPDNRLALTAPLNQMKLSNKLQYDGELIFVLQPDIDGKVYVRLIDPISISGVLYDSKDGMRPVFYRRSTGFGSEIYFADISNAAAVLKEDYPEEFQAVCADSKILDAKVVENAFIYHVKINNDILDRRGIPLVYRAIDWGNSNAKMNNDLSSFINAQAQYAVKKKVKGTKQQIDAMAAKLRQNSTLTNPSGQAGATLLQNQLIDTEMVALPASTGQVFETGIRRSLLMMCSAFGIMEHYFGDPSTGNLATATAMELPMLKRFLAMRKVWEGIFDDIINFVLDMHLYAQNKGALELNPNKNRYKVVSDFSDRYFDIDFPPILEKDLKNLSDALVAAKNAQLIPIETAQRVFLAAAGVNNIDEELQKEFAEKPVQVNPFLPGGPGSDKPPIDRGDTAQEAAKVAKSVMDSRQGALRLADKNKAVLGKIRSYVKDISASYKRLAERARSSAYVSKTFQETTTKYKLDMRDMRVPLAAFSDQMKRLGKRYIPEAVAMGTKYAKSYIKTDESIREAAAFDENGFSQDQINQNNDYLDDSLIPDLTAAFDGLDGQYYDTPEAATGAVDDVLNSFESRVGSYANWLWTSDQAAVQAVASLDSQQMANFVGVDDAKTCDGCGTALEGNPWPIDEAPVPGDQDCNGNCRHALQLIGDSPLNESDLNTLKEAQDQAKKGYKLL